MITNKQKRTAFHMSSEYKRLTAMYKLIDKFFELINSLDEQTLFQIREEWLSGKGPEQGAMGEQLKEIYRTIRYVRRKRIK